MKYLKQTFFAIFLLTASFAAGQSNTLTYADEAFRIAQLTKNMKVQIHFTVVNGLPVVANADKTKFDTIYNAILSPPPPPINTAGDAQQSSTANPGNGAPPPVGPVAQPGAGGASSTTTSSSAGVNSQLQAAEKQNIRNELLWVLFLVNDDSAADYMAVYKNFPSKFTELSTFTQSALAMGNDASSLVTNFGFSESNIIYGITDFAIKRAKQEIVSAYLDSWYQKYSTDPIVSKLAVKTLNVMKAFDDDNSLDLAQYGDKWKAAFQEDLRNLPVALQDESLVNAILLKAHADADLQKELTPVIAGGDQIIYNLYLKQHLYNILSNLSGTYLLGSQSNANPAVFNKMVVLANSLFQLCGTMQNDNTFVPVSLDRLGQMDAPSWKLLVKLFYLRQYSGLTYVFGTSAGTVLFNNLFNDQNMANFILLYKQGVSTVSAYQKLITTDAQSPQVTLTFDDARKLFDQSMQFVDQAYHVYTIFGGQSSDATYQKVKIYYTDLSEIGEGLSTQQYGKVLDGTAGILSQVGNQTSNTGLKDVERFIQVYGSFMVNVLSAKDAGGVSSALDELVPEGQYEVKNTNRFSISLSTYPGVMAGIESIKVYQTDAKGQPQMNLPKTSSVAPSLGVYMPIGIDFNWAGKARNNTPPKYNSTNLMIQAFDLGAVLNYRLSSSSSENPDPTISFKQILSPGLAVMHHFNSSPIVLGVSVNYTPELRSISQAGNTYQSGALRFGIFLSIDVTFLNFDVSTKR